MKKHRAAVRIALTLACLSAVSSVGRAQPVPLIFDTDIGNDVDDALALGMIHSLQSRGECELLAVTITKDHDECAPYVDAVNTFYGRGNIPIGVVRNGVTPEQSKFTVLAGKKDGDTLRYPRDLASGKDAPEAVALLRKSLAAAKDHSVAIAQVGFSTNLARLLDSPPDDISPLNGLDLAKQKVKLLSVMAGAFAPIGGKPHYEYNVVKDIPAAQSLAQRWPTAIIFSGFEIGLAIPYPAVSIERDYRYVKHHPLAESYYLYNPPPHNRPTWDLTSVLYAVRPDRGYFNLSPAGNVTVDDKGLTTFEANENGLHRYLIATPDQRVRVTEAQVQLSSQPPGQLP
ncbi:MAG: nucleoside hydrolase [Planctomycetota bacterium]|nr:nucleoside hydrolase [Planctomycetota bacterium]MDA1250463.1 nucleoside hydrolase [Planctomycetota bacterium]